jgi:hypothetical protein
MIYNTASVFLAGLISMASAASVQHASKSHNALVASGHPTQLVKKINESSYSPECVEAWKIFDASHCWCLTGCALDCSQDGESGKPGTETNPDLCQDPPPKEGCLEQTCDLVKKCTGDDASVSVDGAEPGLDKIVETGGYDCKDNDKIVNEDIPGASWYYADGSESCTQLCTAKGKTCDETMLNEVKTASALQGVIDALGIACDYVEANPYGADTFNNMPWVYQGQGTGCLVNSYADASKCVEPGDALKRRICACS